jgi:hypothetical protein
VLNGIRDKHPGIKRIHFFSDGPTSQYRQKQNFHLFSTKLFDMGFEFGSWNFFAASHGKGIPDAIGGIVKRTADRGVLQGWDITSSREFVQLVQPRTCVMLYEVLGSAIIALEQEVLSKTIKPVPGTMKLHQVLTASPLQILYRDVSCTCVREQCSDHILSEYSLNTSWSNKETYFPNCAAQNGQTKRKKENQKMKNKPKLQHQERTGKNHNLETLFKEHLKDLTQARNFNELKIQCQNFDMREEVHGTDRFIQDSAFEVDNNALKMLPPDLPKTSRVYPVMVRADGDCLPGCGSVYAFGHDKKPAEMRVRIIHELALNSEFYLDEESMKRGLSTSTCTTNPDKARQRRQKSVIKAFTMYSEEYVPGTRLTKETIRNVYETEVLKLSKIKSFMGIWEICALSTVLQRPVFSVYPQLGYPCVRVDLHRLVLPRPLSSTCGPSKEPLMIMWTSNRHDMTKSNWLPNHFVPVIENTYFHSSR